MVNDSDHDRFALDRLKAEAKEINVIWIEDTLTSTDTFTLMRSLDVYASLHRSEGFGLTLAEAMWMGKPVVATGYSGNLEFMDERNSLLVDHQVIETDKQYGPYPVGTRWAEPNIEHAADLMVSLINPHARNKIGLSAHKSIQKTLSEHSLGQYVKRVLDSRRDQSDELFIRRIANA
jgi:glycosyltransferase involved in cell wall biosynthesis